MLGGSTCRPLSTPNIDSGQYPLSPEKVEYARAFTRATDAYSATGDMTGFQELGIFPPAGDPAYEELGISSPDSGGGIAVTDLG